MNQGHQQDFLTVGSMGHASQIALGIAINQQTRNIYCFDGDGATIMHTGNMAIIGTVAPSNYYHVVFNNGAHDSVGGQPTVGLKVDIPAIAKAMGYKTVISVDNEADLMSQLKDLTKKQAPLLLEVKVKKGARNDLGRPTTTPIENKDALIAFLKNR
jgi:phosphonopyruvate decarboxylase